LRLTLQAKAAQALRFLTEGRVGYLLPAFALGALALGLCVALSLQAPPAQAASALTSAQQELAAAKKELTAFQAELDKLAEEQEAAEVRLAGTEQEVAGTEADIERAQLDLEAVQEQFAKRLVAIYKNGGGEIQTLDTIFSNDGLSFTAVLERVTMLNRIAEQDSNLADEVMEKLEDLEELSAQLEEERAAQEADNEALIAARNKALDTLDAQKDKYNALSAKVKKLEEEERKRQEELARQEAERKKQQEGGGNTSGNTNSTTKTTTKVTVSGSWVFPVQGPCSFVDSFGAARSGGRTHKGTDIMTARNTPVVAVTKGTISSTSPTDQGLGGITIHLRGSDGNTYYYAHLQSIQGGIKSGVGVKAGQVIGYAGNTGNARSTAVHLHFEIRPGGGAAINPYPTLVKYR